KGEDDDWLTLGKNALAYVVDNNIISVLTFSTEKNNTIHIYLTYTKPEYRSQGLGTKMFDYIKNFAYENNINSITICTDISTNNPVPNMFFKNSFKYLKTSYTKILNESGGK
ncbi:MAG: GNAT family N-acetyltransferase, partial [Oscillospiraceae bacterium]|nr:GNAT family N-acetyltransferase [Oscillospiraceae bacterium]